MFGRRGRPPYPDPTTPAEARVLDLVREGLPNAEIAVRLGLSINTVKYHVANLLAKAGVASREELRDARWMPRSGRVRGFWPALPLWVKLTSGLAGVAVAGLGAAAYFSATTATNQPPLPPGFERPSADELARRGLLDAGPLFQGDNAVAGIQMRDDLTVVQGDPGARVVVGIDGSQWEKTASGESGTDVAEIDATGSIGDQRYDLVIGGWGVGALRPVAGRPAQATIGRFELVPANGKPATPAQLVLDLRAANDRSRHRVAVASNGHIFIDPLAIPVGVVTDYLTGRTVARLQGSVPLPSISTPGDRSAAGQTFCSDGLCSALWTGNGPAGIVAPLSGELTCTGADILLLAPAAPDAAGVVLSFDKEVMLVGGFGHSACDAPGRHAVVAGEQIGYAGRWVITATRGDGTPVSVGIDTAGRLYLGVQAPSPDCPCRATT